MGSLSLVEIDSQYIKHLHKIDSRVSVKYNNRPFVGVVTIVDDITYAIPLTSQTTEERKAAGKNKRSSKVTTFVRNSNGDEIANLLYNNMVPIRDDVYNILNIDPEEDTYESNEIRFIRKHVDDIIDKARNVYSCRITGSDWFMNKICCDFKKLEEAMDDYT